MSKRKLTVAAAASSVVRRGPKATKPKVRSLDNTNQLVGGDSGDQTSKPVQKSRMKDVTMENLGTYFQIIGVRRPPDGL